MKLDILAFGSHPDDVELGCGGTLAKSVHQGKSAGIIDLSKGELSTKGDVDTRSLEALEASRILGVDLRQNLELPDGYITNDKESQIKVIKKLREFKPEIVIATAREDRHIDHRNTNRLINDSCFLSGLKKIRLTRDDGKPLSVWRPKIILEYIQWNELRPDIIIDITGFLDKKNQSINAYKSQFFNTPENADITPISKPNFLISINNRAINYGRLIGSQAAEGFTSPHPIAIKDLDHLLI